MKCDLLSASRANLYEQCPERYYARYELGKKSGSTAAIGAGLIAHKALELYYRPDFNMTKEECFDKASKEEFCPNKEQFDEARKMFYRIVDEEPKESTNTITTELEFEFFLESGAGCTGFIDRLDLVDDKTIRIVDYKTGEFMPSIEELEKSNQTNMYAAYIFLEEKFSGIETVLFNYKYIRTGVQKLVKINKKTAFSYLEYFDHLYHAIVNDNKHLPTINSFCWNCEHRSCCGEYLNMMSVAIHMNSACGLGNDNIVSIDDVSELDGAGLVDVYSSVSTVSSCIEREKKTISSWLRPMLESVSSNRIESKKNIAKLIKRKDGVSFISTSKK